MKAAIDHLKSQRSLPLLVFILNLALCATAPAHGDLHEQIDALTLQILKGPENAGLYLKRAELFRIHEDWPAAAADYDRAAILAPALPGIEFGRARMLFASGHAGDAEIILAQFLKANPRHAEGYAVHGRIEMKLGNPLAAADDFAKTLEYSARPDPEIYLEQAHALAAAGIGEHGAKAVEVLREGMKLLGNLPTLGLYAIELEAAQKRFDSAITLLDALSTSAPRQEHWLERRGDLLAQAGRRDEAGKSYQAASDAAARLPERIRTTKAMVELQLRLNKKVNESQPAAN
ncbi:MAG: hypothetical protein JWL90_3389 [Chthoniobacteraceae bacterium]|nr:hypothetical protein [Chthoniobacteraceae bacterium]